jgi:hypothetical protein
LIKELFGCLLGGECGGFVQDLELGKLSSEKPREKRRNACCVKLKPNKFKMVLGEVIVLSQIMEL